MNWKFWHNLDWRNRNPIFLKYQSNRAEIEAWMKENLSGKYESEIAKISTEKYDDNPLICWVYNFQKNRDAVLFKLRWSDSEVEFR